MQSKATTVEAYLAELPADRRAALEAVRGVILKNLRGGYEESLQYGMIGYAVPHAVYPAGYHCDPKQPLPFAGLASQKNHMSFYCFGLYADEARLERFQKAWAKTGLKLDMGKSCIRFKRVEDLPLELIGRMIAEMPVEVFVGLYEKRFPPKDGGVKKPVKKAAGTKKVAKKGVAKKATAKTAASKKVARKVGTKAGGARRGA